MLSVFNLKCASCNANLEIKPETTTFVCGFCGASQVVERHGGVISLKLLTDSISKVQAGTDKTAAELAIRRIKEELSDVDVEFKRANLLMNDDLKKITSFFAIILFSVTFIILVVFTIIGLPFGLNCVLWFLSVATSHLINKI